MAQMDQAEIYKQLTTLFRNLFDEDTIVLTPETTAADIEGWDSFNHINLIVAVEAKFGIKFKTAELDELHNVGH
jgi:acyl carrier protein